MKIFYLSQTYYLWNLWRIRFIALETFKIPYQYKESPSFLHDLVSYKTTRIILDFGKKLAGTAYSYSEIGLQQYGIPYQMKLDKCLILTSSEILYSLWDRPGCRCNACRAQVTEPLLLRPWNWISVFSFIYVCFRLINAAAYNWFQYSLLLCSLELLCYVQSLFHV